MARTGCYFSLGDNDKAQAMLDMVPGLIEKKKMGGKDLPIEVFIKKKRECLGSLFPISGRIMTHLNVVALYKEKRLRMGGSEHDLVAAIKISPAEGPCFFFLVSFRA